MPLTYVWSDVTTLATQYVHGIPISSIRALALDMTSSAMWRFRPWRWTIQNISPQVTLVDGTQDYSAPTNIYRLTRARIIRTDTTPNEIRPPLRIVEQLEPNVSPSQSIYGITAISLDYPTGMLRLDSPPNIPSGTTAVIDGDFQTNPTKITDAIINAGAQTIWFPDQYVDVCIEGYVYWLYKLSDDPRAGGIVTEPNTGAQTFSGQLAAFMSALQSMAVAEDYGNAQPLQFPEEPFGVSRFQLDPYRI